MPGPRMMYPNATNSNAEAMEIGSVPCSTIGIKYGNAATLTMRVIKPNRMDAAITKMDVDKAMFPCTESSAGTSTASDIASTEGFMTAYAKEARSPAVNRRSSRIRADAPFMVLVSMPVKKFRHALSLTVDEIVDTNCFTTGL